LLRPPASSAPKSAFADAGKRLRYAGDRLAPACARDVALIYRGKCIAVDTPESLQLSVKSEELSSPTLEDAFIGLVKTYETEVA
jgi:hypothetical protein